MWKEAVAGILSGQISLSQSNVEAVLVLANAAGVSQLLTHLPTLVFALV